MIMKNAFCMVAAGSLVCFTSLYSSGDTGLSVQSVAPEFGSAAYEEDGSGSITPNYCEQREDVLACVAGDEPTFDMPNVPGGCDDLEYSYDVEDGAIPLDDMDAGCRRMCNIRNDCLGDGNGGGLYALCRQACHVVECHGMRDIVVDCYNRNVFDCDDVKRICGYRFFAWQACVASVVTR